MVLIEYNRAALVVHTHSFGASVRILLAVNPLVSLLIAEGSAVTKWSPVGLVLF